MKIYGGLFDPDSKRKRISILEEEMSSDDFWSDKRKSESIISELNFLKGQLEDVSNFRDSIINDLETLNLLKEEPDLELQKLFEDQVDKLNGMLDNLEVSLLLDGKFDKEDSIIEIHSGAGGTEACDWANMLKRMYLRWCDSKNYKYEIIDEQPGEEVGIKSSSIVVHGLNCYGYLKCEKGVHRLIRISPFDSNARRHTSFASVDVTPLFDNSIIDIVIPDTDIRVDVYRSSGNGGQGVNTTDSAVRITHIPTKIVVTCQNERSQIQNREKAMEILKNKLYNLELEKKQNELKEFKGELSDINFGSQIRSYIMHPYSMVKDHRTNTETSNVLKVLDGDIDLFINDNLKVRK